MMTLSDILTPAFADYFSRVMLGLIGLTFVAGLIFERRKR